MFCSWPQPEKHHSGPFVLVSVFRMIWLFHIHPCQLCHVVRKIFVALLQKCIASVSSWLALISSYPREQRKGNPLTNSPIHQTKCNPYHISSFPHQQGWENLDSHSRSICCGFHYRILQVACISLYCFCSPLIKINEVGQKHWQVGMKKKWCLLCEQVTLYYLDVLVLKCLTHEMQWEVLTCQEY